MYVAIFTLILSVSEFFRGFLATYTVTINIQESDFDKNVKKTNFLSMKKLGKCLRVFSNLHLFLSLDIKASFLQSVRG